MRFAVPAALLVSAIAGACGQDARSQASEPRLVLEQTIALPGVSGRIDHLAVDLAHGRLFVAALGNGSVEAVDLAKGVVAGRITGLSEPQGLAYLPERDELVVASGDGWVRFYRGADLVLTGSLKLGEDADNVRVDRATGQVVVGYGGGALAVIDPASRKVLSTIPLPAHPESFRLDPAGGRAWVNLPGAGKIAVVDLAGARVVATWKAAHSAGYPMALDAGTKTLAVVYRLPARLVISNAGTGRPVQDLDACGDADDLFFDDKRHRIYISCGSGEVDVLEASSGGYHRTDRVRTRSGARTGLFVPELDRLFVAARAGDGKPAAVLVMRPG